MARCKEVLVLLNYVHTIPIGAMPDWAMGVGVLSMSMIRRLWIP